MSLYRLEGLSVMIGERVLVREAIEGIMAYYGNDAPLGEL